jgi:hypothetical protein
MNRPTNSFGLGILIGGVVVSAWREIVRFTVYIRRIASFEVER